MMDKELIAARNKSDLMEAKVELCKQLLQEMLDYYPDVRTDNKNLHRECCEAILYTEKGFWPS